MKKIQRVMKKITQKQFWPVWIFAAVQLVYHMVVREPEGSDAMWFFRYQLEAHGLRIFLALRYYTWTSRLVIEAVLIYLSNHILLWKILDWFIWMLLAYGAIRLFPEKSRDKVRWLVIGLLLIYPLWDLSTAGWVATSLNYSWPLALGIFSLNGAARAFYGKKTPLWLGAAYAAAAVYGGNMEQMCAVLLAANTVALLYFLFQKESIKRYWSVLLCWLVSAGEFLFIMTCPGNRVRTEQEIISCMPNYPEMNLLDKLSMGFMDTMQHLLVSGNLLFLLFAAILTVLVFLKSKSLLYRFISIVPLFWNILLSIFGDVFTRDFPLLADIFRQNPIIDGTNYEMGISYIPIATYLLVLWCILISLIVISESWSGLISHILLLAVGLASRVVIGFSPSIYASQERTFLYLYMSLGLSGIWLIITNYHLLESKPRVFEFLKLTAACILFFAIINSLAVIGME